MFFPDNSSNETMDQLDSLAVQYRATEHTAIYENTPGTR